MEDNGNVPIEEKFLDVGDLFGLRFNEGMVFLEVQGWEQNRYSPYTGVGEVNSQNSSGFQRLEDNSDDILFVEKRKKKVIHTAIGMSPAHFRRYTNYPEGQNRLRRVPNLSTPTSGDDFGYVDGNNSPYESPTDVEELFIPPGVHLDFDFYNAGKENQEPVLNIKMREYNIRPLNPRSSADQNAVGRIVSTGSPIPIAPVGGLDNQDNYDLEQHWGVSPISFTEARRIGGVR